MRGPGSRPGECGWSNWQGCRNGVEAGGSEGSLSPKRCACDDDDTVLVRDDDRSRSDGGAAEFDDGIDFTYAGLALFRGFVPSALTSSGSMGIRIGQVIVPVVAGAVAGPLGVAGVFLATGAVVAGSAALVESAAGRDAIEARSR
jgi:hypothetical protein